jgi:hypothetical protein
MNYTAIYEDPFNTDGTSEDGTRVTHAIKLQISSNLIMGDEEVKQVLRRYLSEKFKIAEAKEEKIRIE